MLRKFIKYYKPHMRLFLFDLFCAFVVAVINLLYPYLAQKILNNQSLNIRNKGRETAKQRSIQNIGIQLKKYYESVLNEN